MPKINATVSALQFFFDDARSRRPRQQMTFVYAPRKLPVVLSPDEVRRMLEAAPGLKYKAALVVAKTGGVCPRATSGQAAAPPSRVINSRRLMCCPQSQNALGAS